MPGLYPTVHDQVGVNLTTMEAPLHNKDCVAVGRKSSSTEVSYYADLSAGAQDTTYEVCPSCPFLYKHYDYHYAGTFGLATAVLPLPLVHFRMSPGSSTSAGLVLPLLLCAPVPGADAQVPGAPRLLSCVPGACPMCPAKPCAHATIWDRDTSHERDPRGHGTGN